MKLVRKFDPILTGGYHDWSLFLKPYSVHEYFQLEDDQWRDYHQFESYVWEGNIETHIYDPIWMDNDPRIIEMRRLIKKSSNGLIWQFNAKVPNAKDYDYIRYCAAFGTNTMREITPFEKHLTYPFLRFYVKILNVYVQIYNWFVVQRSLNPVQAQKAVEAGKTVTTLSLGARKYLYRMIDGVLHKNTPFDKEQWKPYDEEKVPEYFLWYRIEQ